MNFRETLATIPHVPRTQLPKTGYRLMCADGVDVLANACPMNLLIKSKWWIKFHQKVAVGSMNISFFEEMARQHRDANVGFGRGLYAISVQTQYEALCLCENHQYTLSFADAKSETAENTPVLVKSINMHKNNRVAWIWLE